LDLQADLGVAFVFITHDLGVVEHVSDAVAVMHKGRLIETGPTEAIMHAPTQD